MSRTRSLVVVAPVVGGFVLIGLPLLMLMMLMGGNVDQEANCQPGRNSVVLVSNGTEAQLTEEQLTNASIIVSEGYRLAVPAQGIVIALAVASQESRFLNYANDGQGNDLKPDQAGIEKSLELPHQAVGSDHGSLGVFQQQWPWWGSMVELMDPATSARKFYGALNAVPGWASMSVTDAAQSVQKSAYPRAYADDVEIAEALLASAPASSQIEQTTYFGAKNLCGSAAFTGSVVMPLPVGAAYVDQTSFGSSGSHWESTHTGTDFSVPCGVPVLASTDGVVTVRTDQSWAGKWLVEVDAGPDGVETWYAHMQAVGVRSGEQVTAGQPIGQVGALGNATGCHLHFEVHPGGGPPVDPTQWLAENVGKDPSTIPAGQNTSALGETAVLLTSNLAFWVTDASAEKHIRGLLAEGPDVLLLQEVTNRNVTAIVERTPGSWAVWQPAGSKGGSVIVWDSSKFSAANRGVELGFYGAEYDRWMPWVLLESDSGTLPVVALHMPTRASSDPVMRGYFQTMTANYRKLVGEMNDAGYPPVLGGGLEPSPRRSARNLEPGADAGAGRYDDELARWCPM
ncbi:M23 family metallopeptidase [Nocardioides sp. 616]|uniref:M23 family metallopeptidase n=1 Tax=Nocardioides sp. 616 TaxID=2268090 RepID=UPI000CE410FF|nr:M23 family metallopeptidase [Nocardioides sp. 616]